MPTRLKKGEIVVLPSEIKPVIHFDKIIDDREIKLLTLIRKNPSMMKSSCLVH